MVPVHLVKINTLKVKLNLSYLITKYTNKTIGQMPTVLVTAGNRGEKPPRLSVTLRQVTAMAIEENEMQTIQRMSWLNIKIINAIITTCVNSSLGVKNI